MITHNQQAWAAPLPNNSINGQPNQYAQVQANQNASGILWVQGEAGAKATMRG